MYLRSSAQHTCISLPFTITAAVCEYMIAGSPGTCILASHVYLQLPAELAENDNVLLLTELSRPVLVMLILIPLWFSGSTVPEGDVCSHEIVLDVFTVGGCTTLHVTVMRLKGVTSSTVSDVGRTSTTKAGSACVSKSHNKFANALTLTLYSDGFHVRMTCSLHWE